MVDQFEAGMKAESTAEEISLYGHVSGTLTVSTKNWSETQLDAKKRKQERQHYDGITFFTQN